jgi:CHRD domain
VIFHLEAIGFVTILLILGTVTNGFINSVSGQQEQFRATLTGSKGVPSINTPATGIATFTLSTGGKFLNYVLRVTKLMEYIYQSISKYRNQTKDCRIIFQ